MFTKLTTLLLMIISFLPGGMVVNEPTNNMVEMSSLSEPEAKKVFKIKEIDSTPYLYLDDYYSNYYFVNSIENYGYNEKGSCTQLAFAQLLAFMDTYWDDSYVPEKYEIHANLDSLELSNIKNSPGIKREPDSLVSHLSTSQYWDVILNNSDEYFHLFIIKMGYDQFGYYNFSVSENPCALSTGDIQKLANYYIHTYLGKSTSEVIVQSNTDVNKNARDFTIDCLKEGIPVELRANISGGGHAMVAYDYDEANDEIYVHAGWDSNYRHVSLSSLGITDYWDAMAIIPQSTHNHTNNYFYENGSVASTICPCNFVIPHNIYISNSYLDSTPTYSWNTLIKDKWFKNIGLYHELLILDSNRHEIYKRSKIYDDEYTLTRSEFDNILDLSSNNYYIYIGFGSDADSYWDDYYCCFEFEKPNTYINKSSFLPSDWGFIGRYYFANELTSAHLLNEPERKTTVVTRNGLTITTDRLRCGYIENLYVVLSPRRENAGRAYLEMNFSKAVYSFMYRACLWSGKENIDGTAVIQVKDIFGKWTTLKDIPLNQMKTKSVGLTQFVEQTTPGIYGLRFEITSTATGSTNKGRFCIDDIVFSTKSGAINNTYVNGNYSTKA